LAFAIRATQKVLKRLGASGHAEPGPPTTALGDWYVNLIYAGRTQLVLCTSERSLVCVVLHAQRLKTDLLLQLRGGLSEVLSGLGVPAACIADEMDRMSAPVIARTASRSVLGSMKDFAYILGFRLRMHPEASLTALSLELCRVPCLPLKARYNTAFPHDVARRLLGSA
jgi:hypothetical protein